MNKWLYLVYAARMPSHASDKFMKWLLYYEITREAANMNYQFFVSLMILWPTVEVLCGI